MNVNKSETGLPRIADAKKVMDYLSEMSAPYGTSFECDNDGLIAVKW